MALSWSSRHLASQAAFISHPCFQSRSSVNSRHTGKPLQHSLALCGQKGSGRPRKFLASLVRKAGTADSENNRARAEGQLQASCGASLDGNVQGCIPEAAQQSGVNATSSNDAIESLTPQSPRFLQKLARAALLALPILLLLSVGGPAIALESQSTETLNSIIVPPQGGHMSLGQRIAVALRSLGLPDWVTIILVAALPVVELRGAIPVGYWLGLKPLHVFGLAVLGNMLPIPLVIAYIGRVSDWLVERSSLARRFFDWLFKRTRSRADLLVKYRTLGLTLFVAVPLPLTGAWSGAIGAHLLGLPFWESILANLAGVTIAGAIVTALCELGWTGAVIAGVGLFAAAIAAFWTSRRKEAVGEDPVV